ncbi:MAG: Fic family protein [Treponema sp.]|nr:Fic family protein [Treponema sp.]MBQ1869979.1 Fic family protein [Treponema sp.]MBQ2205936.1 Fic family protein [Treponema sp.]MBQ2355873.1 Fic family protein [Treponema sp.]MBQ2464003.1 Fic family protein [Treponema sp.]
MYTPPFTITSKSIDLISKISEKIGEMNFLTSESQHVNLRKKNRIKTIHSSLAIENNSLSIEQITAIIDGKRVLGAPNEIQEVKNAVQAYELLLTLDSTSEKDLLRAHGIMMKDLVSRAGKYRNDGVGIFDGKEVVHVAPPAERVPLLMADLFEWLKTSDAHPLVKSCVFHYEFEFIHPFQDGNGRIGRLWQSAILKDWRNIFAWLPVESLIKEKQAEYYSALNVSDTSADSTFFIEFLLGLILSTIEDILESHVKVTVNVTQKVTVNQQKILELIKENPHITQNELTQAVGIARKNIVSNMKKLQEAGLLVRHGADKNGWWEVKS